MIGDPLDQEGAVLKVFDEQGSAINTGMVTLVAG